MTKTIIKLFNSLTGRVESIRPLQPGRIGFYSCGPTVYDYAHIGNFRSFVFTDTLVRLLKYLNYDVTWVMNITDIDDKTINAARAAGVSLSEYTAKFEAAFFADLQTLNIGRADVYPRATEHFKEMRELIQALKDRGYAYETDDGVYFDISKFKDYGKAFQLNLSGMKEGARVAVDEYTKDDIRDFALWKFGADANNQQQLKVGSRQLDVTRSDTGRPGWHIECSAMSAKYLGQPFDIHTGGVDLKFPHHTNEIAQSLAAYGKPLASVFVHNEFLLVDGQKMSKSLGNFYTLRDILTKGHDPMAIRYAYLQSHYREKMNFTFDALASARQTLQGVKRLIDQYLIEHHHESDRRRADLRQKVVEALVDDLNTPEALAVLHRASDPTLWLEFDQVLGLRLVDTQPMAQPTDEQNQLIQKREQLRQQKKYTEADLIRSQLEKQGIGLEDTGEGTRVIRIGA